MSYFRKCGWAFLLLISIPFCVEAQSEIGLKAHYSFDSLTVVIDPIDSTVTTTIEDLSGSGSTGNVFGDPTLECGVVGNALRLDGDDDYVVFFGLVNTHFTDDDFSISFYYKPIGGGFQRSLISKREICNEFDYIDIRTQASLTKVSAELTEDDDNKIKALVKVDDNSCWQHLTVTRINKTVRTYINGILVDEQTTENILDIENNAVLAISNSPCVGMDGTSRFSGLIDELKVYNRGLPTSEVEDAHIVTDKIGNRDTIIFLGGEVQAFALSSCSSNFEWSPTENVSDPFIANPVITPDTSIQYSLQFTDPYGCQAIDTLNIKVIDPADLDCDKIFLPKAFTPNGDGLNDIYHISNPQVIPEFIRFEIFDRWGGRVFVTDNGLEGWDGTANGKRLNPGVFVYQLQYVCQEKKITKSGTITLIK